MNERERILDLVKKGVISSEEGLVLLENLAKKNSQSQSTMGDHEQPETDSNTTQAEDQTKSEQKATSSQKQSADTQKKQAAHTDHESKQDDQKSEARQALDAKLSQLKAELADTNEKLNDTQQKIQAVQKQIDFDQEHITVFDAMEDLDDLTDEKRKERNEAKARVVELQQTIENLELAKDELVASQDRLTHELNRVNRQRLKENIRLDEFVDNTSAAFNDLGEKVSDWSNQVGSFMKDTAKSVMDNIDWNDVTVKVPGLTSTSFQHDFVYPRNQATILDLKNANGAVSVQTWDQPDVKIAAKIKIYGKLTEDEQLKAFTDRSRIDVNDDHLIFQVPNKRVCADLAVYLPKRTYDHISLKLLNGSLHLADLKGKDIYLKTTNGKVTLEHVDATMVEIEDVNGTISLTDSQLHEALFSTVNGSVRVHGEVEAAKLSTINGSVKATLTNPDLHRLTASSVHGNVKVALPQEVALAGTAASTFGQIHTRCHDLDVERRESKTGSSLRLNRDKADQEAATLALTTTTGSIYLKDNAVTR